MACGWHARAAEAADIAPKDDCRGLAQRRARGGELARAWAPAYPLEQCRASLGDGLVGSREFWRALGAPRSVLEKKKRKFVCDGTKPVRSGLRLAIAIREFVNEASTKPSH